MRHKKQSKQNDWKEIISAIRKKNIAEHFLFSSVYVRPWLKELVRQYVSNGSFPITPMALLPSYYKLPKDKEISILSAAFLEGKDNIVQRVLDFREMFYGKPWEWFEQRKFVNLALGANKYKCTAGVKNWRIAKLFERLWSAHFTYDDMPSEGINSSSKTLGDSILSIAEEMGCSHYDALEFFFDGLGLRRREYTLRLLQLISSRSDGFSLGLWAVDPSEIKCPLTSELRSFLETWFPNYKKAFRAEDAIGLFGFEKDCDFFYAYLGFKELQKRNPEGCRMFTTRYYNWYMKGVEQRPCQWRAIIPDIVL